MTGKRTTMARRLKFTTFVLITQMLLIAMAISWLIHMVIIALSGSIYFVENNPLILWSEIAASIFIVVFAASILIMQIRRLGERRRSDRVGNGRG
jgi:uncharacterized membrane protein YbhN (UPF0104 family)